MANLTSPPIDWDGPEPTNTSSLVHIADIVPVTEPLMTNILISPPPQGSGDSAVGYAS